MAKPKAPDPGATAAAQGQWNSFTAQQTQAMNMIGQNSPWGSLNYEQTGNQTIIDPNGKQIVVPKYTANTKLTPEQQAIFNQTQAAQTNLAGLANNQSKFLTEYMSKPFEFNNQDAENWAYDLASQRILPQQQQQQDALRTQLVNQGIRPGTAAWNAEMGRMTNANTDQMNQLALTGRSQAFGENLATRNQPLNEIIGLMSGSQVQAPGSTFAQTPQVGVGGVDYTGLVNQKYQSEVQNSQNMMGGLFGLGSSLIGLFSDERLKTDIKRVGMLDNGLPVYSYRYKAGGPVQIGVMAQDVAEVIPDAVIMDPSGFMRVNYERAVA